MVNTEKTKVGALLDAIINAFADSFVLPKGFLLGEYNRLAASLALLCPVPDTTLTVTAENGRITCALTPAQYRRVFLGERECLRASATMLALLPDFPLYAPDENGASVTLDGDYTVYCRALPEAVSESDADTTDITTDERFLPMLRTALMRSAYLYIGDTDAAKECDALYARELAAYKKEIGVGE